MGTFTFRLHMPTVDLVQLQDVEIRFMEDGVSRKLDLAEWKAYFPGCGEPVVMRRVSSGTEEIFSATITGRLVDMMTEIGWQHGATTRDVAEAAYRLLENNTAHMQHRFGPTPTDDDIEPPTAWALLNLLRRLCGKWDEYPSAALSVQYTPSHVLAATTSAPIAAAQGHPQLRSMTFNEIRRAYDRGDINGMEYLRLMGLPPQ